MMKIKKLSGSLVGLLLMTTSAWAYDYTYTQEEHVNNGFESLYAGASVGVSGGDIGQACSDLDLNCISWKAFAGYRANEHFAIEGGYHNLLSDRSSQSKQRKDVSALSMSVLGIMAAEDVGILQDYAPAQKDLELFGKLGMAAWNSESDSLRFNDGTDFLLGGGAQMKFSDNLGARGEIEYFGGDLDSTVYNAGLTYSTF